MGEIMQNYKFEKKASKLSMKPLDLSCVLRVSQSQLSESGFRDAIIDLLYDRILETLQCHSHSTAFPEIALPVVLQLKAFIKKCPLANYTKKMKQLMEKIKFIEKNRSHVNFDLADTKAVLALENQLKQSGTPLTTYHASWKKMKDREMAVKIARKPQAEKEDNIPIMKKMVIKSKDEDDDGDSEEFDGLFPSDLSEEDDDDEDRFLLKEERGTKRKSDTEVKESKKVKKVLEDPLLKTVKKKEKQQKTKKEVVKETEVVEEADGEDIADQVGDFNMSDDDDEEPNEQVEGSDNADEVDSMASDEEEFEDDDEFEDDGESDDE